MCGGRRRLRKAARVGPSKREQETLLERCFIRVCQKTHRKSPSWATAQHNNPSQFRGAFINSSNLWRSRWWCPIPGCISRHAMCTPSSALLEQILFEHTTKPTNPSSTTRWSKRWIVCVDIDEADCVCCWIYASVKSYALPLFSRVRRFAETMIYEGFNMHHTSWFVVARCGSRERFMLIKTLIARCVCTRIYT